MKKNKKFLQVFSVVALVVAVLGISVGFAAMSEQLSVTGQVKVQPAKWDIKFTNAVFSNNNTYASQTTTEAVGNNPATPTMPDTTFSNYEIVLTRPGDIGTYTVTVENQGDIDAEVSSVVLGGNLTYTGQALDATQKATDEQIVQNNVTYTITWSNGDAIVQGDKLVSNASRDLVITAEYASEATELPSAPVVITGRDLTLTFVQS